MKSHNCGITATTARGRFKTPHYFRESLSTASHKRLFESEKWKLHKPRELGDVCERDAKQEGNLPSKQGAEITYKSLNKPGLWHYTLGCQILETGLVVSKQQL